MTFCETIEALPWDPSIKFQEFKVSKAAAIKLLKLAGVYKLPPLGYEVFLEDCVFDRRKVRVYLSNKSGRFFVWRRWL